MKKAKKPSPSTDGLNGRNENGKFTENNRFGHGNPFAKKTAQLRAALLSAITPDDMIAIIKITIVKARRGQIAAIREVFDRAIGKSLESDLLEKIETLEKAVNEFERANKCTCKAT